MGSRHPRSEDQGRRVRSQARAAMLDRRRVIGLAAAAVLAPVLGGRTAAAQNSSAERWPSRFVRLVVPFPPGGGTDAIARVVAAKLGRLHDIAAIDAARGEP